MENENNANQDSKHELNGKVGFLLGNKSGSYLSLSGKPTSRYMGFFVRHNGRLYRTLEDIIPVEGREVLKIVQKFWCIERLCKSHIEFKETFLMVPGKNSFVYETDREMTLNLLFDFKESYDSRQYGRSYSVKIYNDIAVVEFTKQTDKREDSQDDSGQGHEEYKMYCAIASKNDTKSDIKSDVKDNINNSSFKSVEDWTKRDYLLDRARQSQPFERWVYRALKAKSKCLVFSVAETEKKAISEAKEVIGSLSKIKLECEVQVKRYINGAGRIEDRELELAYKCCKSSLDSLLVRSDVTGLYAGLWWFFQFWTRDETISCKALSSLGFRDEAKKILLENLKQLRGSKLPNFRPDGTHFSADAVGWLFFRLNELIDENRLSIEEINVVSVALKKAIDDMLACETKEHLPYLPPKETWMDSIDRAGVRIEICCQRIFMYKMAAKLSKEPKEREFYSKLAEQLIEKIRDLLWEGSYLMDGAVIAHGKWTYDTKVRPNIFIAYAFEPELLNRELWLKCFQKILAECWMEWGGISTLSINDPDFKPHHSGENALSYHNGDSWFWLDNLAALCMARVSREHFDKYINSIVKASSTEILYHGLIGHHAELSSASELKSEGCLAQAWSSAMFIELVHELHRIH